MNTLILTPIEGKRGAYLGKVGGQQAVVAFAERNRCDAANAQLATVFSEAFIKNAREAAKAADKPAYVATQVRIAGRWHASYMVTMEEWPKIRGGANDFPVNDKAVEKYFTEAAPGRFSGFHVEVEEEAKPVQKAEPKPRKKISAKKVEEALKPELVRTAESLPAPEVATPKVTSPLIEALAKHHLVHGWSSEEEAEIARLQETEGLSRKSAVQKMRRARIKQAAEAR